MKNLSSGQETQSNQQQNNQLERQKMKTSSQGQTHQSGSHTRGSSHAPESSEAAKSSSTQQRSKSTSQSHAHQHSNARPQSSGKAQGHSSNNTSAATGGQNAIGHYILGKALGEGTFGKVKLGTHVLTGEKVAVKVLEKSKIKDKKDIERISREIKILKQLHHPNVVQIYEIIETEKDLYLVMEFASGGELFDLIVQNQKLKERTASRYLQELLAGVHYIHKLGICHRDLKPENLLIDFDGSLKVVDFGLSNMYEPGQTLKTACGSPCYAAPEMIAGNRYHGLKSDIWSCGVVLYAMLCGYLPFEDQKTSNLYKKILNADYSLPKFLSPEAKDIISKIFQTDPEKRIDIEGLKNHPWYKLHQPENQAYNYHNMRRSVNDKLVLKLEASLGFSVESVTKAVENNKHNHLSATYYLLFKKYAQQNYRANQGLQKQIGCNSRQTAQVVDKRQTSPSKQRSTSAQDYDSKISSNSGAKYQKTRAKNPINELNQKEKDRLTAPVQDQLVLKNHRREQSANATAGRTHGAWGHVEDERRTESYERPAAIDDYEIVVSKPQNPASSTIENSRHGQKSGNYPQRSAFVSPSPDPCTKTRRKQSVNQPKTNSTGNQSKQSEQKPTNGALNLSNVRQQPFQQQNTPSQSQSRTAGNRSGQRNQAPNPESKLSNNTQNQRSAEKKASVPPSKSTTPVQTNNNQSKDPQVHRKTKSVMAEANQTQQMNWRTTQETYIGGNDKSGDIMGKSSLSQTQKIRLSKGSEHSRAQSSNLKTTQGTRASNGETSKISNLLDNLNMLTQKTYFDSIVSNQQPSQNQDFSNTQIIKSSKGQYVEIEGTQTSKETISVKANSQNGTSKYDQIKKQQTQEFTNGSKLGRLESGQSNGVRSETQRKEDVMSNQNSTRSPKQNQKEQMRKSLGQPENYSKQRKTNNHSMISDAEKLQQQIMNRTLDGGSNVEIKIPVNPITGGVNKSVFYGTQPMHSHLQNIRDEKEQIQNQSAQNQTKNQMFTSQTSNTQQSEREKLNASKIEAWNDMQANQQAQSKAGKIVSTSTYRSESNPKNAGQHSRGQSASKHTRNAQNTLIGNKQPRILHSSTNQAHQDAMMSQVSSPGLPTGYSHGFDNSSQPSVGDQTRYAQQKLSQSYNTGHKHMFSSTQNNTIEQPNLTVSQQNSLEASQQPSHSLSVVQNPGYRKTNKPEIKTRSYSISGSGNAVTPGHQTRKSHDQRDKLNQSQNVSSAHYRFGTASSINKERKSSLQPTAHNNGAQTTKHRSSSINHNPGHQPSRMTTKDVHDQLSSSQIGKNLDSRRPGGSVPTQKKSQSRQGRADSMQLSIPNDRQMFQSITYHSNQVADGEVFNSSFSNAPSSQSNYNKRKQQTITHMLNSTEGLKQYALNKNLARKGDDQSTAGMSMQTNNLFMPSSVAKSSAQQTKQNAMMTSDLGLSIKDMYKQLQNGGSLGTQDTKSYLTNGQMHPQQQLQATQMPHGNKNLNQTAHISMKHVNDEPFSLNSTQNMSSTIQNQSYLSDLFKQKMTSKPQQVIQITPTSAQTPGQRNSNPNTSIFSPASKNRAQSGKPVQQSQSIPQTNFIQRDYGKQQLNSHITAQQTQYSHSSQTANLLNQLVQQNSYTQQNSGQLNHLSGNYAKNLSLTSSHDMGATNYMGINSTYTPTGATMTNNFMIQPQMPQNNNLLMQQYQMQNQQHQYTQNTQQMHQQPYYQPAQINLSGVVPPPSNQTKRIDSQNAPSYTYMAAQQLADLSNFQHRDEKMR